MNKSNPRRSKSEAFDLLVKLMDLAPMWTSVHTRLPDSDGFYLVYQEEFPSSKQEIRRFSKQGKFLGQSRFISHWMPLPANPTKEGI
jgi:hypothetical protein